MRWTATLLVLALAGSAPAQDASERYIGQCEEAIRAGGITQIVDRIDVDFISRRSSWARRICEAAADTRNTKRLLRVDRELRDAANKIAALGAKVAASDADSTDALRARIAGTDFRLRVLAALGDETETDDWLALAAALEELHDREPDGGEPLERAVRRLREGAEAEGTDADRLAAREKELCRKGAAAYPGHAVFAGSASASELDAIEALLEAKEYKEAKPRLQAVLETAPNDTVYNDAVTLAKEHKRLYLHPDYRMEPFRFGRVLAGEMPAGDRWKKGDDWNDLLQYDRRGELKRKFTVKYFRRNTWYVLDDQKFDGSNVKGMAEITERDVRSAIARRTGASRIARRRLNHAIGSVLQFDVGGFDVNADFVRFRSYLWKGDERDWLTFRLWLIEWEDFEDLDPEAEAVLDSLHERKYEKK